MCMSCIVPCHAFALSELDCSARACLSVPRLQSTRCDWFSGLSTWAPSRHQVLDLLPEPHMIFLKNRLNMFETCGTCSEDPPEKSRPHAFRSIGPKQFVHSHHVIGGSVNAVSRRLRNITSHAALASRHFSSSSLTASS